MDTETIAAVATAPGEGGVAVIRISGQHAFRATAAVFSLRSGANVEELQGYTVHYGDVVDAGSDGVEIVDDALLTVFRAPISYTGEDVCEISCHGGTTTTNRVLELVLRTGARPAEPGEFTQRAFMNGRIDLAQAEAVADLVSARTESARRLARRQLEGSVSHAASLIREEIVGLVAAIEVTIDFSDEVGELDYADLRDRLAQCISNVERLISSASRGRIIREGLNVTIIGRPNVGKSSLLNALLRSDRAIVTPVPGTTRDTIEESHTLSGMPVVLVDTAGLRETDDPVERIGVERSLAAIVNADVCLVVLDAAEGIRPDDIEAARAAASCNRAMIVINKCDLVDEVVLEQLARQAQIDPGLEGATVTAVSATTGEGIEQLEELVAADDNPGLTASADPIASAVVSNARHIQALADTFASLELAAQSAAEVMPGDFIAIDLRGALDALGQITGETVTDDIIHRIFRDFCVGK